MEVADSWRPVMVGKKGDCWRWNLVLTQSPVIPSQLGVEIEALGRLAQSRGIVSL